MTNDEIIAKFYEAVQSGDYQSFLDTVLHTQYIGARYVPLFADPLQWSSATAYEPLTIVTNQGNSYTSRQYVPTGVDIANTDYWALTGNYNAQVEQYRQEVQQYAEQVSAFDGRIQAIDEKTNLIRNRAFIIGNSYTNGYDNTSRENSIAGSGVLDKMFNSYNILASSASGFVGHSESTVNFYSLITTLYSQQQAVADEVTDIIFNVAVGDSYALVNQGAATYTQNLLTQMSNIKSFIDTNMPNVKRVMVVYLDALHSPTRNTGVNTNVVTLYQMQSLNKIFYSYLDRYDFIYMGWPTVSLFGSQFMNNSDNTHPTVAGYNLLTQLWVDCLEGNNHANDIAQQYISDIDISTFISNSTMTISNIISQNDVYTTLSFNIGSSAQIVTPKNWVSFDDIKLIGNSDNNDINLFAPFGANFEPMTVNFKNNNTSIALRALGSNTAMNNYFSTVLNTGNYKRFIDI